MNSNRRLFEKEGEERKRERNRGLHRYITAWRALSTPTRHEQLRRRLQAACLLLCITLLRNLRLSKKAQFFNTVSELLPDNVCLPNLKEVLSEALPSVLNVRHRKNKKNTRCFVMPCSLLPALVCAMSWFNW